MSDDPLEQAIAAANAAPPAKTDRMERLEAGIAEVLKEIGEIRTELRFLREAAAPRVVSAFGIGVRVKP